MNTERSTIINIFNELCIEFLAEQYTGSIYGLVIEDGRVVDVIEN